MDEPARSHLPESPHVGHWILRHESADETLDVLEAGETACQKLLQGLAQLVTRTGVEALLARASYLAQSEFSLGPTAPLRFDDGRCLGELEPLLKGVDPEQQADVIAAVLGNAIRLLTEFIGSDLVFRRLNEVWPALPFDAFSRAGQEDKR